MWTQKFSQSWVFVFFRMENQKRKNIRQKGSGDIDKSQAGAGLGVTETLQS